METILIALALVVGLAIFLWIVPIGLYYQCKVFGINLSLTDLVLMRWRKVSPGVIANALIKAKKEGIDLESDFLQAYYLAYGNVYDLIEALIYAKQKNVEIDIKTLSKAGLEQKDLTKLIDSYIENEKS